MTRGFAGEHALRSQLLVRRRIASILCVRHRPGDALRARVSDVETYASDRQAKGFNAVFLMSVQPDMNARGPVGRNLDEGFEIGFHDLAEGRLNKINVEYFQYFDKIINSLIDHGITPVLQPVFHGYGWKGSMLALWCRPGVRPLLSVSRCALRRPPSHLPALR